MDLAGMMIESGQVEYALVVDGESSRFVQEQTLQRLAQDSTDMAQFRAEFATLTLGSGSVAMLLGRLDQHADRPSYKGSVQVAASEWSRLCRGQVDCAADTKRAMRRQAAESYTLSRCFRVDTVPRPPCPHQVSALHAALTRHGTRCGPRMLTANAGIGPSVPIRCRP